MDIKGKISIFPKMRGTIKFFEGTISNKSKDGKYINISIECKFGNKEKFTSEKLSKLECGNYYYVDVKSGFLSVDAWEDKTTHKTNRKIVMIITDATIEKSGKIEEKKESGKIDTKKEKADKKQKSEKVDDKDIPF